MNFLGKIDMVWRNGEMLIKRCFCVQMIVKSRRRKKLFINTQNSLNMRRNTLMLILILLRLLCAKAVWLCMRKEQGILSNILTQYQKFPIFVMFMESRTSAYWNSSKNRNGYFRYSKEEF